MPKHSYVKRLFLDDPKGSRAADTTYGFPEPLPVAGAES
jgi:hypothetical protein